MLERLNKILPPKNIVQRHYLDGYGALHILAKYVGFKKPIFWVKERLFWQHGWFPDYWQNHPLIIATVDNKDHLNRVAKKSEEEYLIKNGYWNTKAMGLPIVYVEDIEVERVPNTLLVMPVHSLNTVHENWPFQEYVDEILAIKSQFDKVVVCIHPLCIRDGLWINEFKAAGFEILEGILGADVNSLKRLQIIMKSFEFVTTNGFGSHIAYSAYFGAKISVFGSFAHILRKDYENYELYKNNQLLLDKTMEVWTEEKLKSNFQFLFTHPKEATQRIEWGKYELGSENKLSKNEVLELLGWQNFYYTPKGWKYWLSENLPESFKKSIKSLIGKK